MGLGPEDREAFRALYIRLYTRQADGTLTTWMTVAMSLEASWQRPEPFGEVLESARAVRLLRGRRAPDRGGASALLRAAGARRPGEGGGGVAVGARARERFEQRSAQARRSVLERANASQPKQSGRTTKTSLRRLRSRKANRLTRHQGPERDRRPRANSPPSPRRSGTGALDRSLLLAVEAAPDARTPSRHARVSSTPSRTDPDSCRSCTSRRATSGAWPSAPTARPSPPDTPQRRGGGGVVLWDVAARRAAGRRAAPREGGRRHERGLQPRRQDPRRRITARRRRRRGAVGRGAAATTGRRAARREEGDVRSVAFSPDGKTIAAGYGGGSGGGGVVLWDVAARDAWRTSRSP